MEGDLPTPPPNQEEQEDEQEEGQRQKRKANKKLGKVEREALINSLAEMATSVSGWPLSQALIIVAQKMGRAWTGRGCKVGGHQ
jgi:type II secretory pathway component PulF